MKKFVRRNCQKSLLEAIFFLMQENFIQSFLKVYKFWVPQKKPWKHSTMASNIFANL